MLRLLKAIFILALLGFIGLAGYAYLGDMAPKQTEVNEPVELNVEN
ncbi:hypothetical protein R5H32_04635 [Defluviimonas sp. D31]|nr:hypothetical protein [Defluviimonas sp. D31]MDW4548632.1 hypothetical protein [Defluviimonas sp. D31]